MQASKNMKGQTAWGTSPLLLAVVGLIGTALGWLVQGHQNAVLEEQKFQSGLIQAAFASSNQAEAASRLRFLKRIKLIDVDDKDIRPEELPVFRGAALRDRMITRVQAKQVLTHLKFYDGPLTEEDTLDFQIALMRFQRERGLDYDALLGPKTLLALWEGCPTCPELLRKTPSP
jgi:hypothetical protein